MSFVTRLKTILSIGCTIMGLFYGFKGDGLAGATLMLFGVLMHLDARIGRIEEIFEEAEEKLKPKDENNG